MFHLHIFTDGSVNTKSKVGYGAYLVVTDLGIPLESLSDNVKVKCFEQTSSTKLELQTLLWAVAEVIAAANGSDFILTAYTDSQNIIGLPKRRTRLEQRNYCSSKNKQLNNYALYQEFYRLTSVLNCEFVKVLAHQPSHQKNGIDKLFALVDQASRSALREDFLVRSAVDS